MATSRPKASALDQVRSLLTAAEEKVLHSTMGAAIAKATREQVEATMTRARAFRDKWRDLHAEQTRSTKRSPATIKAANQRSREKHEVFADAVKRLEARLAEFASGVRSAVSTQAARLAAGGKPRKAMRQAVHRETRKGVRGELKAAVADMNRVKQPKAGKPAAKAAVKPAAAPAKPAAVAEKPAAPVTVAAVAKSKKQKKGAAPAAVAAQRQLKFDAAGQRAARTAVKQARLTVKGAKTRRASHLMASVKRSQAKRDGRGR
jgi:hypothetical protein